jgi:hypothetical protein
MVSILTDLINELQTAAKSEVDSIHLLAVQFS